MFSLKYLYDIAIFGYIIHNLYENQHFPFVFLLFPKEQINHKRVNNAFFKQIYNISAHKNNAHEPLYLMLVIIKFEYKFVSTVFL